MKALLEKSGGLIYAAEVPEEPKQPTGWETKGGLKIDMGGDFGYTKAMEKYHKTLASAKESAVLCADQRAARKMICDKVTYFKNESGIYPIPSLEWDVKEQTIHAAKSGPFERPAFRKRQVAILKESTPSNEQESQEELWNEVLQIAGPYDGREEAYRTAMRKFKSRFIITRRKT